MSVTCAPKSQAPSPYSTNVCIVIPARSGSSRFPGKMLAHVSGRTVLSRTVSIARAVKPFCHLIVATNDEDVRAHARDLGVDVVMTDSACRNGTERVHAATHAAGLNHEILINLQGDAVLTPPWVLEELIDTLVSSIDVQVATPVVSLGRTAFRAYCEMKASGRASGTLAVVRQDGHALYFTKGIVPHLRAPNQAYPPAWRHIGCYGYKKEALARYMQLSPSPLEEAEQLEQLRFLEYGTPVLTVPVDYRGRTHGSIDYPEDIAQVEAIIAREGELTERCVGL